MFFDLVRLGSTNGYIGREWKGSVSRPREHRTQTCTYIYIFILQNFSSCSLAAPKKNPTEEAGTPTPPFFFFLFPFSVPPSSVFIILLLPFHGLLCRRSQKEETRKDPLSFGGSFSRSLLPRLSRQTNQQQTLWDRSTFTKTDTCTCTPLFCLCLGVFDLPLWNWVNTTRCTDGISK